jgi:hypothetical protein
MVIIFLAGCEASTTADDYYGYDDSYHTHGHYLSFSRYHADCHQLVGATY